MFSIFTRAIVSFFVVVAGGLFVAAIAAPAAATNSATSSASSPTTPQRLTLAEAVGRAQRQDPWLQGSLLKQQALAADSLAAGSLPDPVVSLGVANLPTDTFEFNQEAMTQFKLGVMQSFPRGDSLALGQERLTVLSEQQELMRQERRAQVAVMVASLWLDAFRAQESIRQIEADRGLFEYLLEVTESNYANVVGQTRQQDVIRAQLELTRLNDRISALRQQQETALGKLGEWLGPAYQKDGEVDWRGAVVWELPQLSTALPDLGVLSADTVLSVAGPSVDWLAQALLRHPAIRSLEQNIEASEVDVALAKQKYKPQWGVNAGYGYRDDAPTGTARADFFSVGVSFDLPLFTGNRQDQEVASATASAEAGRTKKWLALRTLRAGFESQRARLLRLNQREALYRDQLLGQLHDQAESALNAYTNDDGDFAEVVRARIDELNARVDVLAIRVERLRSIIQLNYYLAGRRENGLAAVEEQS